MALWIEDFIQVNHYTRPAIKLIDVRGIVMHYTADPGATALNERNYFNKTAVENKSSASAHIFVDKNEARLIIPFDEVAYHANEHACRIPALKATKDGYAGGANLTAIGVEMCIEKDGSLHPDTLARAEAIVTYLCKQFKLDEHDIYRHYDITGKNCPSFWVSNPAGFTAFTANVTKDIKGTTTTVTKTATVADSTNLYRVRKTWADASSQKGAYGNLASAKALADETKLNVYDKNGNQVYPVVEHKYPLPTGVLKKGDKGTAVLELQKALIAANFYPNKSAANGGADGIYGNDTYNAVLRFQKVYGNPADGIYGDKTRQALDKLIN